MSGEAKGAYPEIDDGVYVISLIILAFGFAYDFIEAYTMLEEYDPMGLKVIIPALCFGGLLLGLIVPKNVPEWEGRIKWTVCLLYPVYAVVALFGFLERYYGDHVLLKVLLFLFFPILLWGYQIWRWRRYSTHQ